MKQFRLTHYTGRPATASQLDGASFASQPAIIARSGRGGGGGQAALTFLMLNLVTVGSFSSSVVAESR